MPAAISIAQTRTLPQLTEFTGPIALTDVMHLHIPTEHDGASAGDFHVTMQGVRDAVVAAPITEYVPASPEPITPDDSVVVALAKLQAQLEGGTKAFVGITDITPTSSADNVFNRVKSDDDYILQSCTSTALDITVSVLAVTGLSFKPTVDVNGVSATLSRNALTDVWMGSAAITLEGPGPHTITATHGDGNVDTAIVNMATGPVITDVVFEGAYPSIGQTEHASGQVLQVTVTADRLFVELTVQSGGAVNATSATFAATASKTINVTVADRGNIATDYPVVVRVRDQNGTWSAVRASNAIDSVDGVNTIRLNNTRPLITWDSIVYSSGFSALKDSETATVNVIESNVDTVVYTSPGGQLSITNPLVRGNKEVTRISGDYNISTDNLQVVAGRTANATTATFSRVVAIAHVHATLTITAPFARLRSSVGGETYTITATSSQVATDVGLGIGGSGQFTGTWTSGGGVVWTNTILIKDTDVRGVTAYTGAYVQNLAGKVNTATPTGNSYTVGGFTRRTLMFAPFTDEALIGTYVLDASKLRATNLAQGTSGIPNLTYQADDTPTQFGFTITDPTRVVNARGNRMLLLDTGFVSSNTETVGVEIEEVV